MTPKERAAMKLALEALELHLNGCGVAIATRIAYDALREALEEQAEHERKYGELAGTHNWTPPNYTDEQWQKLDQEYQDHVAEQALQKLSDFHQSIEEPACNQHPDAPHGFDRNASHCAGRYVCECEGWEPEPAEQEDKDLVAQMNIDVGLKQKVYEALAEQAEQGVRNDTRHKAKFNTLSNR